jgi:hypothetical protein
METHRLYQSGNARPVQFNLPQAGKNEEAIDYDQDRALVNVTNVGNIEIGHVVRVERIDIQGVHLSRDIANT